MDTALPSISPAELASLPGRAGQPLLLDVRRPPRFAESPWLLPGALHCAPADVASFARSQPPGEVIVYCVHGHGISQAAAGELRTAWITRNRPKADRIACPWLVLRFIDPRARLHYVPASTVADTGRPDLAPQSAGLPALSQGLSMLHGDDHAMPQAALPFCDALYAWCRAEQGPRR